ncbi:hypothetical protein [Pseudoalteromonas phenolica]|nr:hypothetical protein [Pseudoalteromonas phenolica]
MSNTKLTGNSLAPSITPENKQLMSNVLAWMRAKPRWHMDVPSWRLHSHQ